MRLLALLLAGAAACAQAQDYEREKRWAAEVVPNLVVGDAVQIRLPNGREFLGLYTETKGARTAVVLVHGLGVHPDHSIIGSLRSSLADAGHSTLSIQMPVLAAEATAPAYPATFPEAVERIRAAAAWLQQKGSGRYVLLSHSMGSRMSGAYYETTQNSPFSAWICMGLSGEFGSLANVRAPVLDVYGEKDFPAVLAGDWQRRMAIGGLAGSRQVRLAGADHFFTGREKALSAALAEFIGAVK